ncbi:MAG: ParB-like protein [Beijerinckiaceae bacterium]|nr:ParB-like protein [Beijerinckiaceae bacterium]
MITYESKSVGARVDGNAFQNRAAHLRSLLYVGVVTPAILLAVSGGTVSAGQLPLSAFSAYNPASASTIVPGTTALYAVPVASLLATQLNEGFTEVSKKATGFDLLSPSQLQASLLTDIEPVVIGPGGKLYLTDGHHTFTALLDSVYGSSNPTVYVNVIANYSNLTLTQFYAQMQSVNELLPLNNGVAETVNDATGAPLPTSLTGLTNDPYRGLEYSILKNKSSTLFKTASNITGAVGASTPGLDKMTGFYSDFLEAAAYRNANNGLGLPYLSPGDIALATAWNLNPNSKTSIPNVTGTVSAAQLPGFILSQNIVNSGGISNTTLANGAMDGFGTFTGITEINAGTAANPILVGTPNTGFVMQLGNDAGNSVTLNGTNTYTGGTSILAGNLIVQSDASLGAATPANATINPANVLASVQAANGIVFNSLTEGNGTLTIGTTTGGSFSTNRPIAVDGEVATINVNGNNVTLTGQIVSLGTKGVGIGNATGISDLTIDDLSGPGNGKLTLSTASPYFYGNIIIGNTGAPTVTVMSDAALGNTTGPAVTIGSVELNGGTFQAGANITGTERNFFLGGGSSFDVNGFTTSWGTLTDVQRTLEILNSNSTTAGAVTFSNLTISATAALQLAGGTAGETVTFTNGISRTAQDTLILFPSTTSSLGTTEKVFSGTGAASLENGIAPAWIVENNANSKSAGPYDFVTYGANGYVKATYSATALTASPTSVVALAANSAPTGNVSAFALNTEGKNITLGASNTLTLGDGTNPAGLILASGTTISNGTLAFGGSEGVIWLSGTNPVISSKITGTNGLTFAGSGGVTLNAAENVSGLITIDSGTVTLGAANVFSSDIAGILLDDTKSKPAPATLDIAAAGTTLTTLNTLGKNSSINLSSGASLVLGDTTNNLSSVVSSTVTQKGTTAVAGAITLNGSGLFDFSGGKADLNLVAGSTIVVDNSAQFRAAASEFANANFGVVLNNTSQLQFAQNLGGVFSNTVSGTGSLNLIGGTLQITSTNNTYSGGTFIQTGSILDITTANLPAINPNITNAGGYVLFDQTTNGTYAGVISDGAQMGVGANLSGSLIKDDSTGANSGNVTVTKQQTFTGATFIEAGTLTLGAVDALINSSGVDLGRVGGCVGTCSGTTPAATLALGANNTLQALMSEAGNTTAVTLGTYNLTIDSASGILSSFGGTVSGTGSLIKNGTGAQAFTGAVTTGGVTVNAGVLDIGNGGVLTAPVTTVTGGTLELDSGSTLATTSLNTSAQGTVYAPGGANLSAATFDNSGILNLNNGTGTNVFTIGTYVGAPGSQLQIGVNFGTGTADELKVSNVSGTTQISIAGVGSAAPAYNPTGIPIIVSSNPMNPNSFTLAGGPIQRGLFQYDLAYQADPAFVLVGAPTADAYRLATLPTAAQSIWLDTASLWLDRQAGLRDQILGSAGVARPVSAPKSTDAQTMPGVWAQAMGEWANRSETQTYGVLNKSYVLQTGYTQNTGAFYAGADGVRQGVLNAHDTLLFGVMGGYIDSTQMFMDSTTSAHYTGGSVGASASYLIGNFFVDTLFKGDFLNLNYASATASAFGANQPISHVDNLGFITDAGYRFTLGGTAFAEPLATLAYVSSHASNLEISGSQVNFGDNDILRGRLGLRSGIELPGGRDYQITVTGAASYWARLSGGASATINSGAGAPLLTLNDQQVTNYGDIGAGINIIQLKSGWSGFLKGDYQFASSYGAGSIKAGVRFDF